MVMRTSIGLRSAHTTRSAGMILAGLLAMTSLSHAQVNKEDIADPPAPPYLAVPSFPRPSDIEARILQRLSEPASTDWYDKKFEEALNDLEDQVGFEIWIDKQAMQDEGLDTALEVSLKIEGVSLRTIFRLLLEPLAMVYVVEDEVLKITTYKKTETRQSTRIYPVADLCETPQDAEQLLDTINCGLGDPLHSPEGARLVVSSKMKTLTVRGSYVVQEKVQILLLALRDAQLVNNPPQVAPRAS